MDRPHDDQIRADVERALHDAVGLMFALPRAVGRRLQQCVSAGVDRATAPVQIVRSFADLALGRLVSPVEDDLGSPRPGASVRTADAAPSPVPTIPAAAWDEPAVPVADDGAEPDLAVAPAGTEPIGASAGELPIDEYESLAASHVVARLPSLTADELRAVRAFEAAHRGRRTVLGKIDQLLAAGA